MNSLTPRFPKQWAISAALVAALILNDPSVPAEPLVFSAPPPTQAPQPSPGSHDDRPIVAIYEFRSGVPEVGARATTDLFVTALVHSSQFHVVERARINEGVIKEKQLGAQGLANGDVAQAPLHGARYLFEGAVTEASASEDQRSSGVNIGGMEIGGGSNHDVIAIDVRVLDAASGEILDVVTVRRDIHATNSKVAGVGNLVAAVMSQRGQTLPIVPDMHVEQQHKESLDSALRSAIEEAVHVLAGKFGH
jgi:curli biogenesis system outer membrane secretion channel CsgG